MKWASLFILVVAQCAKGIAQNGTSGTLIVGGTETRMGEYLFTAGIRSDPDGASYCGGVLIDRMHVLTAAHCVDHDPEFVILGAHFTAGQSDGQIVAVVDQFVHPRYRRPQRHSNDLAILRLAEPAQDHIPILALTREAPVVGQEAIVCGFGLMRESGEQSPVKRHVHVPILSNDVCSTMLDGIDQTMVCAGYPQEGRRDACHHDSGGPLFIPSDAGEPRLIGIVSWGIGCGREALPGVYSRISSSLDFIQSILPNVSLV